MKIAFLDFSKFRTTIPVFHTDVFQLPGPAWTDQDRTANKVDLFIIKTVFRSVAVDERRLNAELEN